MPKIRNIIIFVGIALALGLVYFFFIKADAPAPTLETSSGNASLPTTSESTTPEGPKGIISSLPVLLNIQNIKLNDDIFSSQVFNSLHDSTATITYEKSDEGRPNPFAPIGSDTIPSSSPSLPAGGDNLPADTGTPPASSPKTTTPPGAQSGKPAN